MWRWLPDALGRGALVGGAAALLLAIVKEADAEAAWRLTLSEPSPDYYP
jgi:hypothetical protein